MIRWRSGVYPGDPGRNHEACYRLLNVGRCRSGKQWFWCVGPRLRRDDTTLPREHGWTTSEARALEAAQAAIRRIAAGRAALASVDHGYVRAVLKHLNQAKRAGTPPSRARKSRAVRHRHRVKPQIDLDTLRQAMVAAHPDRGGSSADFIAARQRYVQAQQMQRGKAR